MGQAEKKRRKSGEPEISKRLTRCEVLGVCQALKRCKTCPRVDLTNPQRHNLRHSTR